ncbi:MAG: transglycosylase SLT domain-containing protein [Geobacteraceae bacterium]|nr:transglycosylase SLT domain-containing protein [Geobacteraceae bacterium]
MGVGIDLRVDARQVKEARKEVDFLNKGLREMEDVDIAPDKDGLQTTSALIRKITEDIRRMKGLVVKGEQQGSLLKKEQFQEAATLSKRIGQNMADYTKEITKARTELGKLLAEKAKLGRVSSANPHEWVAAQERIESLNEREKGLRSNYERLKRQDPKAHDLLRRGAEYTEAIGGYGDAPGEGAGGSTVLLGVSKKAIAYGAALFGVGSVMSMIKSSWDKTQKLETTETGLLMRGVSYDRRVSPWNFTPQEEAEGIMGMRRMTGAGDMESLTRLERFARLSNIDMGQATGLIGGYYNVTGADPQKQRQAIDALLFMGKQAKDGRSETLLGLINQNLMIASRAQGGRALTGAQASSIMAQTSALYNAPGTMGFSSNLFQTMQGALMPGGDPGSELMKWDIIGGFDKGPLNASRILDLERRRNAGLNDPTNLRRALAAARKFSPTRDGQIFYMMKLLAAFGQPGGVDQATAIIDNGNRLLSAKMPGSSEVENLLGQNTGTYRGSLGFKIGQRDMEQEVAKLNTGDLTENAMGNKSAYLSRSVSGATSLINAHKYDSLVMAAARRHGISPSWFLGMIMAESGGNPKAKSPKGALGIGQMLPGTFAQFGRKGGNIWDPADNLDASAKYAAFLFKKYGVEGGTMSYNEGPGNYEKGLRPAETLQYLGRVKKFAGTLSTTGGLGGWDAGSSYPVAVLDPSLKNAWDTMIVLLDKIARNTGNRNFAPGATGSLRPAMPVGP